MLEGIRGLLETAFESVVMVADETSLFEVLDKLKPELAVVDLSLPLSGEVNIVRKLHENNPDLKFIVLSVYDEQTAVDEVMSAGASGFVLKRCAATDLLDAVEKIELGGSYVSPSIKI
jgi:DNA-binding NarL/FixJ family response regulator